MLDHTLIFSIFLIFTGAAVLASIALFARQSLLVTYILLGGLVGPWGLQLVSDATVIQQIGHIGIIMLVTHAFAVACISQLPETKGREMGVDTERAYDDDQEEEVALGDVPLPEEAENRGHLL